MEKQLFVRMCTVRPKRTQIKDAWIVPVLTAPCRGSVYNVCHVCVLEGVVVAPSTFLKRLFAPLTWLK